MSPDARAATADDTARAPDTLPIVRRAVRDLLTACPAFAALDRAQRQSLAQSMVRVCDAAATLIHEELDAGAQATRPPGTTAAAAQGLDRESAPRRARLARAQAGGGLGAAASQVAGTTRAILNAVSFPRFVTDLINGVFRAMLDSSAEQMRNFVELLNAVAATTEGFADSNVGPARARAWLVEHYPAAFEFESEMEDEDGDLTPEERAELAAERREVRIRARPDGQMPSEAALRADLGLEATDTVPTSGDPERTLVPLVRARLARTRQESLATMVRLGLHRIVIDSGRISASMRFHIDTRDAMASDQGSRFGLENEISAAGSFGFGPWGASASVRNNISYVSTQRLQSTSELNTDFELNSAVDIYFKSDYVPLNTLANDAQLEAIRGNSRNPAADAGAAAAGRREAQRAQEGARRDSMADLLRPGERREAPREGAPGTEGGARRAQEDAAADRQQRPRGDEPQRPLPPGQRSGGGEGGAGSRSGAGGAPGGGAPGGTGGGARGGDGPSGNRPAPGGGAGGGAPGGGAGGTQPRPPNAPAPASPPPR